MERDGTNLKVWALSKTEAYGVPTGGDWSAIVGSPLYNGSLSATGGMLASRPRMGTRH